MLRIEERYGNPADDDLHEVREAECSIALASRRIGISLQTFTYWRRELRIEVERRVVPTGGPREAGS